ncbi:MAG: DNA alkylation repair protein [Acutalibacteraceae bacterium]|nr:DNA alkylation repair protein [Acutalibacteraceae bacterium]
MTEEYIRKRLFELQDISYREFHSKLIPTVEKELVIGVRTPDLRKLAKEISKTEYSGKFLEILPHKYYEENNLHAFLIEEIKDYDACIAEINRFLPFVDNWATCDMMRPQILKNHLDKLLGEIKKWIDSDDVYAVRFGIEMLMCHYLDDAFSPEYPEWISRIRSNEYYIRMMVAWYFATALSKRYNDVVQYIENYRLDADTHNKTIRKAIESYRITAEQKAYLRKFTQKR